MLNENLITRDDEEGMSQFYIFFIAESISDEKRAEIWQKYLNFPFTSHHMPFPESL